MANPKASPLRFCRSRSGWRRLRVKPIRKRRRWKEEIQIPYSQEIVERGECPLRCHEGERSRFRGIGRDLREAITSQENQIATLEAERAAGAAGRELVPKDPSRVYLFAAREKFLEKKRLVDRDQETIKQYENLTAEFLKVVGKKFADEVEELDLLRFCDALRKRGCVDRSLPDHLRDRDSNLRMLQHSYDLLHAEALLLHQPTLRIQRLSSGRRLTLLLVQE